MIRTINKRNNWWSMIIIFIIWRIKMPWQQQQQQEQQQWCTVLSMEAGIQSPIKADNDTIHNARTHIYNKRRILLFSLYFKLIWASNAMHMRTKVGKQHRQKHFIARYTRKRTRRTKEWEYDRTLETENAQCTRTVNRFRVQIAILTTSPPKCC